MKKILTSGILITDKLISDIHYLSVFKFQVLLQYIFYNVIFIYYCNERFRNNIVKSLLLLLLINNMVVCRISSDASKQRP